MAMLIKHFCYLWKMNIRYVVLIIIKVPQEAVHEPLPEILLFFGRGEGWTRIKQCCPPLTIK